MRIIEPNNSKNRHKIKPINKKNYTRPLVIVILMIVSSAIFLSLANSYKKTALNNTDKSETLSASVSTDDSKVAGVNDIKLKFFTGEQFLTLVESLAYPNTHQLDYAPVITGDTAADTRIRTIAESRGYVLRKTPVFPIVKTGAGDIGDDDLMQPRAFLAWKSLKNSAKKDGIPLELSSGYRSIERQRQLFVSRLTSSGVNISKISDGTQDNLITQVLSSTAPPGYSRHHTGYAMDLVCDDGTGQSFKYTDCFAWLKSENYKKPKQHGIVPSYPNGAEQQGPEPEPWEYIWVGIGSVIDD